MIVWIASVEHKHGVNTWACSTEEKAELAIAQYARTWWSDAQAQFHEDSKKVLGEHQHLSNARVIEVYFEIMEREHWAIDSRELDNLES